MAFIADNVLSEERCASLMEKFQAELGWETTKDEDSQTNARECQRLVLSDPGVRDEVWAGIGGSHLPDFFPNIENGDMHPIFHTDLFGSRSGWEKGYLDDCWRVMRCDPGGKVGPHNTDRSYVPSFGKETLFTVLVYLNEVKNGGETIIFGDSEEDVLFTVYPKPGSVLVFSHNILHQEKILQKGTKWVIRSDVVYKVPPSTLDTLSAPARDTLWQLHKVWREVSGLESPDPLRGETLTVIYALKEQKFIDNKIIMGVNKIIEQLRKYPVLNECFRDVVKFLKTIVSE